ncbi:MAG: TonB-dependent receptor [Bergeyella sp.]
MSLNIEIKSIIRKRTLGLVFVLGTASMAFAQEKMNISGKIMDKGNQPVPYASVTFTHPDNKLFSDAVLTDEQGNYAIQLVPGNYTVIIEAIDYKKSTLTKAVTTSGNIGNFTIEKEESSTLTPTKEIQGVTITAQSTKPYKVELDKKTYNVSADLLSKGGNLQDVLQNVPSVNVDTDGTVSMRGNSNVRFLINGKPSSLLGIDDGANALQSIPSESIERIEVITNPSSKYEASGTAGILNIILKKEKKTGFNGSVTGSLGYLPSTSLNANLNWKKGDWTWYVNGGGGYKETEGTRKNETTRKEDVNQLSSGAFPFTQYSNQKGKDKREGDNYNLTAGLVRDFGEKTSVNLSGMIRSFSNDTDELNTYDEDVFTKIFTDAAVVIPPVKNDVYRERRNIGYMKNFATQADFGIDQKLDDNGQNLSVSGSFQTNKTDGTSDINQVAVWNNNLSDPNNNTSVTKVISDSKSRTFIGKADYELPMGEKSRLEAGARYDFNRNTYNYDVAQNENGGAFSPRLDFTSNTIYKENILGIYAQFKSKIGEKFAYQLGLRSETSSIDISFDYFKENAGTTIFEPAHETVKKDYTKLFPSAFLSYEIGEDSQLLLNYSRRINRPRAFSLIPFMSFSDDRNYFRGNPDLNPSYENSLEFGYSVSKKKFTFNPTIYYKKSEDEENRYQYMDDNGAINIIPYNIGTETNYGLDLNGTYDPFKWWKIMLSADLYGYKSEGTFNLFPENPATEADFSGDGYSYRLRTTNTFKPNKNLNIQIQAFYRNGEKTAMNNRKSMYGIDFGATQTIWNGNGTLAFNVRDVFNTRKMRMDSNTAQFTRSSEMQWQPRQFSVSLTYRFKQGERVEVKKKQKDINNNYQGEEDMGGGLM